MLRVFGILLIIGGLLAGIGELCGLALPTLRWPFETSRQFDFLRSGSEEPFLWFGWLLTCLLIALGVFLLIKSFSFVLTPITRRRLIRFKSIKRGWISFLILIALAILAMLDQLLVGNQPLLLKYKGDYYSPALQRDIYLGETFGLGGAEANSEPDYIALKRHFEAKDEGDWLIMPPVPYSPTGKSLPAPSVELEDRDGVLYSDGKPYNGLAARLYDPHNAERPHLRYRYRQGLKDGVASGWDQDGGRVWSAQYQEGRTVTSRYEGEGSEADFLNLTEPHYREVFTGAAPPMPLNGHLLGTTSESKDVLAYLYGGLQINFKAALFYIPFIYLIGVSIGLLMGFWGGAFDLGVQRLIEILSNVPYLYVIIILSASVPEKYKGLGVILIILIAFGWMGMTYLMRSMALKEKSRDYVAASRVLGASTPRLIFRHILPNSVAIIVTLIPFSISTVVLSLTSLDYLGFGLPPSYATWGRLLADGLQNLTKPWLVSSAFFCLVSLLILITFVGEAVREAFDPKKFTYYR